MQEFWSQSSGLERTCRKGAKEEMKYKFEINQRLPGLNDYTKECRTNKFAGAQMKKKIEYEIWLYIMQQLKGVSIKNPVFITFTWVEENGKRDLDNISAFAHKVIQDGLVKGGLLENDGWKNIVGFSDEFFVDKENPRIEIMIREVEANGWEKNVFKNNNW